MTQPLPRTRLKPQETYVPFTRWDEFNHVTYTYFIPTRSNKAAIRLLRERLMRNREVFTDFGMPYEYLTDAQVSEAVTQGENAHRGQRLMGVLRIDQIVALNDERLAEQLYRIGVEGLMVRPAKRR